MNIMSTCIEKLRTRFPQDGKQLFQIDKTGELRTTIAVYHVIQNEQMAMYFTTGELMTVLDAARLKCFRAGTWGKDLMGCRNFKELMLACHVNKGEIVGRILAAADYARLYPECAETSKLWRSEDLKPEEKKQYEEGILKMAAIYHLAAYAYQQGGSVARQVLNAVAAVDELSKELDRKKTIQGDWLGAVDKETVERLGQKWASDESFDPTNPPLRPTFQSVRHALRPWGSEETYEHYLARAPFSQYALKKNAERWLNLPPHVAKERLSVIPQAVAYALEQYAPVLPVYAGGKEPTALDEGDLFSAIEVDANAKLERAYTSSLVLTIDQAVYKFSALQDKSLVQFHVPEKIWRESVTLRKEVSELAEQRGCEVSDELVDEVLRQWQESGKVVEQDSIRLMREGLGGAATSLESMARERRLQRAALVDEAEGEEIADAVVERDEEDCGIVAENQPRLELAQRVKMHMADLLDMIQGEPMAVHMLLSAMKEPKTPLPEPIKRVVMETLEERDEEMARTFQRVQETLMKLPPLPKERLPQPNELNTPAGRERAAAVIGEHLISGAVAASAKPSKDELSGQISLKL
jgi:hypothetical protein